MAVAALEVAAGFGWGGCSPGRGGGYISRDVFSGWGEGITFPQEPETLFVSALVSQAKKNPQEQISASQNILLCRSWKETLGLFFLLNHLALSL